MNKLFLLILSLSLVACGNSPDENSESKSQPEVKSQKLPKPISEYAFNKYTKDQFPRAYAQWGDDWMEKIQILEKEAANKIANERNSCDSIDIVGLSENKSTPKKEVVFFVDCINGERFYVSDKDLDSHATLKSQSEKSISVDSAFDKCRSLVSSSAQHPSSVNFKILDSNSFKAQTTGNVVITLGFTAKNSLGAELPAKARCVFSPDGESEISFIE